MHRLSTITCSYSGYLIPVNMDWWFVTCCEADRRGRSRQTKFITSFELDRVTLHSNLNYIMRFLEISRKITDLTRAWLRTRNEISQSPGHTARYSHQPTQNVEHAFCRPEVGTVTSKMICQIARSLSDLTKKQYPWKWNDIHQKSFKRLKEVPSTVLVLKQNYDNIIYYIIIYWGQTQVLRHWEV